MIKLIGIDFDETLALTEDQWRNSERKFFNLMAKAGASPQQMAGLHARLVGVQKKNVRNTGYSCALPLKSFVDLVLDVAPELVNGRVLGGINKIVDDLRDEPVVFFDDVKQFMDQVNKLDVRVVIITKGEIHHQNDKIQALETYLGKKKWNSSYVVGDKTQEEYFKILKAEGISPKEFVMVGDSVKSDINPVIKMGGKGIFLKRTVSEGKKWTGEAAQVLQETSTAATLGDALKILKKLTAHNEIKPRVVHSYIKPL